MDGDQRGVRGRTPPAVSASLVGILLFIGATRQVGADPAARLAARRDGRPDAGLRADPRRDDGDRRRLPGRAAVAASTCTRPRRCAGDRGRSASPPRSSPRPSRSCRPTSRRCSPTRRSRSSGFMFVALGVGAYGVGDLPPVHARVLQGLPVPRRRQRDPRARRRAGHPQDGRPRAQDPGHVRRPSRSPPRAIAGIPPLAGFFSKDEILWFALASERGGSALLFARGARSRRSSPRSTCSGCCGSRSSARRA